MSSRIPRISHKFSILISTFWRSNSLHYSPDLRVEKERKIKCARGNDITFALLFHLTSRKTAGCESSRQSRIQFCFGSETFDLVSKFPAKRIESTFGHPSLSTWPSSIFPEDMEFNLHRDRNKVSNIFLLLIQSIPSRTHSRIEKPDPNISYQDFINNILKLVPLSSEYRFDSGCKFIGS